MNSPTLHPEWKQLVEFTKDCPYGHSYSHEQLATIMRLEPRSQRYFAAIHQWKRHMLSDYRRCVEVKQKVGYRIIEPSEHTGVMRKRTRQAGRRLRQAVDTGVNCATELLTQEQNLRLSNTLAKVGSLSMMQRETLLDTRPSLPITKLAPRPKMLDRP